MKFFSYEEIMKYPELLDYVLEDGEEDAERTV